MSTFLSIQLPSDPFDATGEPNENLRKPAENADEALPRFAKFAKWGASANFLRRSGV
jgi:hypothetical protein